MKVVYCPHITETPFVLQTEKEHHLMTLEEVKELRRTLTKALEVAKR